MHLPPFHISKKFWPLMAVLFLFFLGLGAAGWKKTLEEASGRATVSEIAENTIEMISGHDVVVVDHKFEEHWMLLVGKWGLKGVLAAALFQSGLMLFRRQIRGTEACGGRFEQLNPPFERLTNGDRTKQDFCQLLD